MVVFIIEDKNFTISKLRGKKVDLIYLFNEELYDKLSSKYKVVLFDKFLKIKKENFFNKDILDVKKRILIDYKIKFFEVFEQKYRNLYRKKIAYMRRSNLKRNIIYSVANKKDNNEIVKFLDEEIFLVMLKAVKVRISEKFVEQNKEAFKDIFNYITSLYRAYCYSFGYKRGSEILLDLFRFKLFYEIANFYFPNSFDLYKTRLKKDYIKVLSRLFIEDIHKNLLDNFLSKNLAQWLEFGWFKEKK